MNLFYSDCLVVRNRLFEEPRCRTMAAIGIAGLALTGAGMGLSLSGAGQTQMPNLAASTAQLSNLQAEILPIQRQLSSAAQLGQSVSVDLPEHYENQQFIKVPEGYSSGTPFDGAPGSSSFFKAGSQTPIGGMLSSIFGGGDQYKLIPYVAADWQGKTLPGKLVTKQTKVKAGPHTFDFTGLGAADVQAKLAEANAKTNLALSQKYDPQFIAMAKAQEQEADPQGVAARQRESELIQQQINQPANQPVADTLQAQVEEQLKAGKGLDEFDTGVLNNSVAGALGARGGSGTPGDFTSPLTTGAAGAQRQLQGIGLATGELSSGTTPEDVAYRREQQNLADLSAEISGQTPTSEFKSLSAAQNGPTPTVTGSALPTMPGGQTEAAGSAALNQTGTQIGLATQQANPWMAGLSSLISAGGAAGSAGYKPFGS